MQSESLEPVCSPVSDHLVRISESEWAFWRWACLRSAGFPARDVLKLRAPEELTRAADELVLAEKQCQAAREEALRQVDAALDELRREDLWNDKVRRGALLKARDRLKQGQVPKACHAPNVPASLEAFSLALKNADAARIEFERQYAEAAVHTSGVLREVASDPYFREAVIWQNRRAIETAVDQVARESPVRLPRSSKRRQHEELIAGYLQRYSVKNDTIGFFGPVGWAKFVSEGAPLVVKPGKDALAARKVFFEFWPIQAIAAVIAKDPAIYPWLRPIMMPFIRVEGSTLHHPSYGRMPLALGEAALLNGCDGCVTARDLACRLLRTSTSPFTNEADVYKKLTELAGKRVVFWGFNIPMNSEPESALCKALLDIEDPQIRQPALAMLDQLEKGRREVESAAGNAEALNLAFDNLESTFTRLTSLPATRSAGQTYAGRTLVYEDCRRDVEVRIGPKLVESIGKPLSLLLDSARWVTHAVASVYTEKLEEIYAGLVRSTGQSSVDASAFWLQAIPYLYGEKKSFIDGVRREFQQKWDRILNLGSATHTLTYKSEELQPRVAAEFAAPAPGWVAARYHSPDIMIAASSVEAVVRGDFLLVLGEVHVSANTLSPWLFVNQHPASSELFQATEQDMGTSRLIPVTPRTPESLSRLEPALLSLGDLRLEYAPDSFAENRSLAVPVSSLVIEKRDGRLMARSRDERRYFDAMELASGPLVRLVLDSFRMLAPRRYCPRIMIDRLVIKRESWRFAPSEIELAREDAPAQRFLRLREWARTQNLPRCVFFKVPIEKKPVYLDFDSPILVDLFAKAVRRVLESDSEMQTIDFSEMLPGGDETWLCDAGHNHYTSELRLVALDSRESNTSELRMVAVDLSGHQVHESSCRENGVSLPPATVTPALKRKAFVMKQVR